MEASKADEFNKLFMAYLQDRGYIDTLITFENETKSFQNRYEDDVQYIREVLTEGKFSKVFAFIDVIGPQLDPSTKKEALRLVKRQFFLETLFSTKNNSKSTEELYKLL